MVTEITSPHAALTVARMMNEEDIARAADYRRARSIRLARRRVALARRTAEAQRERRAATRRRWTRLLTRRPRSTPSPAPCA